MRARYLVIGIVAAALVASGLALALRHGFSAPDTRLSPASVTSPPPTETAARGLAVAPKVTDIPAPPGDIASKVADTGIDSLTAEERAAWQKYLAETAAIVSDNADGFRSALEAAIAAIVANDTASLYASFAPDEDVSLGFAESLVGNYPQIKDHSKQPTVGIFSVGKANVYFGYAVVRWQDADIVSEHTIAIPMRFIGGHWYLTSIGSGTEGLTAVQSVRIEI